MIAHALTVLKAARGELLTKIMRREADGRVTSEARAHADLFVSASVRVQSLGDLYCKLLTLTRRPSCCVIRGAPLPHIDPTQPHYRLIHDEPAGVNKHHPQGRAACYQGVDRRWLCLDVDTGHFPPHLQGGRDLAACARWVIACMPAWVHDAGAVVHWSSSAGHDGWIKVKAHVWVWLTRPVCDGAVKSWVSAYNLAPQGLRLDPAIYQPVQPHYTADPILEGLDDPCLRPCRCVVTGRISTTNARLIYLDGPAATPPAEITGGAAWDLEVRRREQEETRARRTRLARAHATQGVWAGAGRTAHYAMRALERAEDAVAAETPDTCYPVLRAEIMSTQGLVKTGALEDSVWEAWWWRVWEAHCAYLKRADIERLLRGARAKAGARELGHVGK